MTTTNVTDGDRARRFNAALWAAQVFLAIVFAFAGAFKAFTAPAVLLTKAPDLAAFPLPLVRFIGIAELAAAAGLILPALTRIAPILTPIAAACVLPVMGGAFFVDLKAGDFVALALVIVCSALAWCVAWARFTRARIEPRGTSSIQVPARSGT